MSDILMAAVRVFFVIATLLVCGLSAQPLPLRLLESYVTSTGARCIDGSPAGYYYGAGNGDNVNDWLIYIQGGGWCYSESSCYSRSLTALGSSKGWAKTMDPSNLNGILSSDCSANPTFCRYNHIIVNYCDGTSFTSNNATVTTYNGTSLYFRGRLILDAVLDDLKTLPLGNGWNNARNVLLSGCSAGGLSTYHAADYVGAKLPASVQKYGAIPVSGYFLLHDNVESLPVYPTQMSIIYQLGNCSYGVGAPCLAATAPGEQWKCIFAENTYPYIKTPIFVLNSMFDSWQLACIYLSEFDTNVGNGNCSSAPGWQCINKWNCTADQYQKLNSYASNFVTALASKQTSLIPSNGGFIVSCYTHCEGSNAYCYDAFDVKGISMRNAVDQWWTTFQSATQPQWHWDCASWSGSSPHSCNPTCHDS